MEMNDVINALISSKKIGITFHVSPDGDSLGSSLALMQGLIKVNKKAYIISKDSSPEIYNFLPFIENVNNARSSVLDGTDCVIVLDCGNFDRISADLDLKSKDFTLINIDHHISNDLYGHINLLDTRASSVGEIIYRLLLDLNVSIDENIASCLFTSIVSDTGWFRHSNTSPETHTIASELIKIGVNFSEIHRILYEKIKFKRIKLYGKVIDKMYLTSNDRICIMKLTKQMLEDLSIEASDTSDIISIGMEVSDIEVAVLIKETDGGVKISLRSKSKVDVRKIAENFGGGGHLKASGLFLNKDLNEAEETIIKAIEKELI
jgi:phosphoesterase RecJ-like protein